MDLYFFSKPKHGSIKVQCLSSMDAFKVYGILIQCEIFKLKTGFFLIPVTCVAPFKYAPANNKTVLYFDLKRNVIDQLNLKLLK